MVPPTTTATHRLCLEIQEETAHVNCEPPTVEGDVVGHSNDKTACTGSKSTDATLASADKNESEKQAVSFKDILVDVEFAMGALMSHEAAWKRPPT